MGLCWAGGVGMGEHFRENLVMGFPAKQVALESEGVTENGSVPACRDPLLPPPPGSRYFCSAVLLPCLVEIALKTPAYTQQMGSLNHHNHLVMCI